MPTVNHHIKEFQELGELDGATIRKFRIVRQEGTRQVEREIEHYGLDVAFYVGYRVNSAEGKLFRRWATSTLVQLATKGFVVDVRRLKEPEAQDRVAELREILQEVRACSRHSRPGPRLRPPRQAKPMIITAWAIFRASLPLQLVALALAGWAALAGNNYVQRQKGAAAAVTKIEKKADANASTANEVRESVDAGKRGKPDPHLRRLQ